MTPQSGRVLGIDLAAQARNTCACVLDSAESRLVVALEPGCSDARLLELAHGCDKVAIDAPFGWPDDFVDALNAHREHRPWPAPDDEDPAVYRESLSFRATDRVVRQTRRPLSVSTDKLGVTAMRCAHLLQRWSSNAPIDRSGNGRFVEVYPAGALKRWGLEPSGYKGADKAPLGELLAGVRDALPSLRADEPTWGRCAASHDAFDALVAALVARAALVGLTDGPPAEARARAAREGWIHLPLRGSLELLTDEKRSLNVQPEPALAERLRAEDVEVDSAGYVSRTEDVLLPTLDERARRAVESDFEGKGGSELRARGHARPKFHAAHSSAALAANTFGPFLTQGTGLPLAERVYEGAASLEAECPSGLPGTPPTLDLLIEGDDVLGVESKCTEPFTRHEARFAPAYAEATAKLPRRWREEYDRLVEHPLRYRYLDAAQLVKHCLGLRTRFGERRVTLAYIYWTPSNAAEVGPSIIHAAEVAEFAERVHAPEMPFVHLTYRTLWDEWSTLAQPPWLRRHAAALRRRYDVAA